MASSLQGRPWRPRRLLAAAQVLLCVLMSTAHGQGHAAERIRVVTEELPPYSMTSNGRITGFSTELVEEAMRRTGISAPIESMPWERAYELALHSENVLIYSISRTVQREKLFKWIGDAGPPEIDIVYALATRHLVLNDIEDARAYRLAAVQGDVLEEYLLGKGFRVGTNLIQVNKFSSAYAMLKSGHVDAWAVGKLPAYYYARQAGDDPAITLTPMLKLTGVVTAAAAMAFSAQTPDALVQRFRSALESMHRDGTFDRILRKWL